MHPVDGPFPPFACGWRGERVYVLYRTGVAENRFDWDDAGLVNRKSAGVV